MTDRTPTTAERKAYAKGYADGAKDEAARTPVEPEGRRCDFDCGYCEEAKDFDLVVIPDWKPAGEVGLRAALEEPTP